MKKYPWFCEHILGIGDNLTPRAALGIVLASILCWGAADLFAVHKETNRLLEQQNARYVEKSQKLSTIIQRAELILSLGYGELREPEKIFRLYEKDLRQSLGGYYYLTCSLILLPTQNEFKKFTEFGWVRANNIDKKIRDQILVEQPKTMHVDPFGNLVLSKTVLKPEINFLLQLGISTQSLGKVLAIDHPRFLSAGHTTSLEATPLKNNQNLSTFIIPLSEELSFVYFEPEITLTDHYIKNLQANGIWLLVYIALSYMGFVAFYRILSLIIEDRFSSQIRDQQKSIISLTEELSEKKEILAETTQKFAASKLQSKSEAEFLNNIKTVCQRHPVQSQLKEAFGLIGQKSRSANKSSSALHLTRADIAEVNPEPLIKTAYVDLAEIISTALGCFELTRLDKQISVVTQGDRRQILIPTRSVILEVFLYNILRRIFSRIKRSTDFEIEYRASPDLVTVFFVAEGYPSDPDQETYFSGSSGISMVMMKWAELLHYASNDGVEVRSEEISSDHFRITMSFRLVPTLENSKESKTNVVPFIPKV